MENLTNTRYDQFKQTALLVLPALGTLYFAIAQVWGLPYGQEVVGTIAAIDTFLGFLVHRASSNYTPETDATLHVTPEGQAYAQFNDDPKTMSDGQTLSVEVKKI